jgi:AbrB family looped-hinge helix DNA binding protein
MSHAITMDRTGRIVVPIEVRRRLNLAPGARLMLDVVAQRIELTPELQAEPELLVKAGRRTVLRPTGKTFDAAAATRAEREAQSKRGSRG